MKSFDESHLPAALIGTAQALGIATHSSKTNCYDGSRDGKQSCSLLFEGGHIVSHVLWGSAETFSESSLDMISVDIFLSGRKQEKKKEELYKHVNKVASVLITKLLCDDGKGEKEDSSGVCTKMSPIVKWTYQPQGFLPDNNEDKSTVHGLNGNSSIFHDIVQQMDIRHKTEVDSFFTPHHRVDIWDFNDEDDAPTFYDGLKSGLDLKGDKRWLQIEYVIPVRMVFIDGELKNNHIKEVQCSEAQVHPSLLLHPYPRNVAIINQPAHSILREVLKHDTVSKVTFIQQDEMLMKAVHRHIPAFVDCSVIENSKENCLDDDRVEVIFDDPAKWFKERFSSGELPQFDVIIMEVENDLGTPPTVADTSPYLNALYNSLSSQGILSIRAGSSLEHSPNIHDPWYQYAPLPLQLPWFALEHLQTHPKTAAVMVYEEPACGIFKATAFILACRDESCRERWQGGVTNDVEVEQRLRQSQVKHYEYDYGKSAPSRSWETVYCRREPMPEECQCQSLHEKRGRADVGNGLEIRKYNEDEEDSSSASVGVFATVDIAEGDYIMAKDLASSLVLSQDNLESLHKHKNNKLTDDFLEFVTKHGHSSLTNGKSQSTIVEVGGSLLIRRVESEVDANVDRLRPFSRKDDADESMPVFSPVLDRHHLSWSMLLVAKKDIKEGEEILVHKDVWN